ncbi:MAG TPA: sugar phosphate isomerase/epimerase [Chloroflexota bacterium]|jgi:sugar phosphate isomerase/epimerase|nr:sugar phosphate isomerase/epimerase [Chloroflexota bacterium]
MTAQAPLQRLPVALQLYTVREQLKDDFRGVVRAVAEIGYDGVQFAGYGGLSAVELRRLLEETGLRPCGTHTGLETLERDLEREIEYNQAIGNEWIVCPSIPEARRRDLAGWREVAAALNRIGAACAEQGVRFGYHNHAFEFSEVAPGTRGLDIILGETDPSLVFWEPDVYWVFKGGADPAEMIRTYAGRVPITHLKDATRDERQTFAEVGEGALDWPAILEASQVAGVVWHCVEQDRCERPPLESVRLSLEHLRSWGMGERVLSP